VVFQANEAVRWDNQLKKARDKMAQQDRENFLDGWTKKWKADLTNQVNIGGSTSDKAQRVYDFLSRKYDWRNWNVMVYNEVRGWSNHAVNYCGDHFTKFSWNGINIVVNHIDINKVQNNRAATVNILNSVETKKYYRVCPMFSPCKRKSRPHDNAKKALDSLVSKVNCNYSLRASIKTAAQVHLRSAHARCSRVDWKDHLTLILCD
jgi:hypothetical protein